MWCKFGHVTLEIPRFQVAEDSAGAGTALATAITGGLFDHSYLRENVLEVVLQKSIPPQIRQLMHYTSNSEE